MNYITQIVFLSIIFGAAFDLHDFVRIYHFKKVLVNSYRSCGPIFFITFTIYSVNIIFKGYSVRRIFLFTEKNSKNLLGKFFEKMYICKFSRKIIHFFGLRTKQV